MVEKMKVKYIGDTYKVSLIKGKIYSVEDTDKTWYRIIDETGEDYLYPPDEFETVKE